MDERTLAEWDRRHAAGESWRQIGDSDGLTGESVKKRVLKWRRGRMHRGPRPVDVQVAALDRDALLAKFMDALTDTQDALKDLDYRQPVVTLDLQDAQPILLVFLSDLHIGGTGVDHRQMQADMECIRDTEGAYATSLGDHCDNFSPRVIPAGMLEQLASPQMQWDLCEMFLRKYLAPKLLVGVEGNHDAFSSAVGLSPCKDMYRRLQVPYLGAGGRVWLKAGDQCYKLELRHDFAFKSSLNTTNSQRRLSEIVLGADVVALGHLHFPDLQYVWKAASNQILLRSSTYKRHDSYAEAKNFQFGYAPSPLEMAGCLFWPDKHKVLPFRDFHDALPLLHALRR